MANVKLDTKSFDKQREAWLRGIKKHGKWSVQEVGDEILRISINGFPGNPQVPHDQGILQSSATREPAGEEAVYIGFNTEYAARLHEHPEYKFQKNRKGKYLEDPIKDNINYLGRFFADKVKTIRI